MYLDIGRDNDNDYNENIAAKITVCHMHCVKSVQIRGFTWSSFSRIQSKFGKIRTRKNSVFGHFSRSDDDEKHVLTR